MKFEQLIILVVSGVIIADLVAHIAGTQALFNGFNILWSIGTNPTDTASLNKLVTPMSGSAVSTKPIQKKTGA